MQLSSVVNWSTSFVAPAATNVTLFFGPIAVAVSPTTLSPRSHHRSGVHTDRGISLGGGGRMTGVMPPSPPGSHRFVFKMTNFAFKMVNFAFKMVNFSQAASTGGAGPDRN